MAAVTDRGENEQPTYVPAPSHVLLNTITSSSKLDSCIKTHYSQHRRQREGQENLEWEEVIGSLTCAAIEVNFDSLKPTRLLPYSVQWLSSLRRHLRCIVGKTRDFLDLKINTIK